MLGYYIRNKGIVQIICMMYQIGQVVLAADIQHYIKVTEI
jgi:hypothetical protein